MKEKRKSHSQLDCVNENALKILLINFLIERFYCRKQFGSIVLKID